ncbi:MAG: PQQ-binding-like beta-propeller repeat protein [Pirellulales bacterium]
MTCRFAIAMLCLAAVTSSYPAFSADRRPAVTGAATTDWREWRGPTRDGISGETGLLAQWPQGGPPLAWKTTGLGSGFSSLSLVGDRIYTLGDRKDGQFVIALSRADGKELWSTRIGELWEPGGYSGPRCTPTVDGNFLYVIGPHGNLVCLAANNGKIVWQRHLHNDFAGPVPHWGFCESPLIDGNKLICTPGGPDAAIVALDKKTGADIWRTPLPPLGNQGMDGAAYSSIVIGNGGGVRQYVQLVGRGVVGLDAKTGKFLWGYNRVANGTASIPTPVIHDDYVFCSSGYGTGAALLKLSAANGGIHADEVYFLDGKEFQNHHGGMILLGDYLYAGHGHNAGAPTCLEWKTGKTVWRQNRGPGSGSAAVAYADGNLYVRFQNGVVALIGATPSGYEERGKFEIPDVSQPSWSHPVIAGGKLYLREQDALYCYDLKQ